MLDRLFHGLYHWRREMVVGGASLVGFAADFNLGMVVAAIGAIFAALAGGYTMFARAIREDRKAREDDRVEIRRKEEQYRLEVRKQEIEIERAWLGPRVEVLEHEALLAKDREDQLQAEIKRQELEHDEIRHRWHKHFNRQNDLVVTLQTRLYAIEGHVSDNRAALQQLADSGVLPTLTLPPDLDSGEHPSSKPENPQP